MEPTRGLPALAGAERLRVARNRHRAQVISGTLHFTRLEMITERHAFRRPADSARLEGAPTAL